MLDTLFETKVEIDKKDYAKFIITPLEKGYGNTLGNALRRVLLSSLSGAAITSVRIGGVRHQFSTLKGLKEDVVELLLNLKKVHMSYSGSKPAKGSLSVKGPCNVTAGDLEVDPTVKISNPDLHLATLNKDAKLDVKFEIENGTGYSLADERKTGEIGMIPLDASFSPVIRVNYKVEETRVGRQTNFDKLVIEVWTDGTMLAKDVLIEASKILITYFNQIVNPKKIIREESTVDVGLGQTGKLSVEEINLPTRVANALVKAGYETVEDLFNAKRDELVKVRNLGEKSVKIIEAALGEKGLKFS